MENDKFRSRVEGIERMAEDDKAHQELGKRLVQQVAVAVAEEKRGAEITDPDVEFTIAKGQPVPRSSSTRSRWTPPASRCRIPSCST